MEIFVSISLVIMALAFLFKELTQFIKQLHTSKPNGLLHEGKVLNLMLSFEDRKKEACAANTNFQNDDSD